MDNNELPFSRRLRKLVLAGIKIAVFVLAWNLIFFDHTSKKTKDLDDSSPKTGLNFIEICLIAGLFLSFLKLSESNQEQFTGGQLLTDQLDSTTVSTDSDSTDTDTDTEHFTGQQLHPYQLDSTTVSTDGDSTATDSKQLTDGQVIPNRSTSTSIHNNSTSGASQLRGSIIRKEIKIMTYNLCHPKKKSLDARMRAITLLMQEHVPDVVLFQEVTSEMHEILRSFWTWYPYKCVTAGSNCMVLSKLATNSLCSVRFMLGGELLLTKTEFSNGKELIIATSHLKCSTRNSTTPFRDWIKRFSQAVEGILRLHHYTNVIFGGDMNWQNGDGLFPLQPGWIDAWEHIRPHEAGYTFETKNNPLLKRYKTLRERLDRFLCKLNNFEFEVVDIEIIGKEEIAVAVPAGERGNFRNQSVIISDHYGLILTIRVI